MEIWTPQVGDDSLYLKCEDENKHGKYAVAVMIRGKTDGHIPKNLSRTFNLFQTLPNCVIKCIVVGSKINQEAGTD